MLSYPGNTLIVYNGNQTARKLTNIKSNEIFNGFALSRQPFDEIDSNIFDFKDMNQKIPPDLDPPD